MRNRKDDVEEAEKEDEEEEHVLYFHFHHWIRNQYERACPIYLLGFEEMRRQMTTTVWMMDENVHAMMLMLEDEVSRCDATCAWDELWRGNKRWDLMMMMMMIKRFGVAPGDSPINIRQTTYYKAILLCLVEHGSFFLPCKSQLQIATPGILT